MSTPSFEMEKKPNPAVTLRGFHAPRELVEKIEKQHGALRREMKESMLVVQKCISKEPSGAEEKAKLDSALKWLGKNAGRMDDTNRISAFFSIVSLVEERPYCMDALEAGIALSRVAKGTDLLAGPLGKVRDEAVAGLCYTNSQRMRQDVELAAALGAPKAIRLLMFWESMGMVSGAMERIESVHPEAMEMVRKEIEEGRKMSGG